MVASFYVSDDVRKQVKVACRFFGGIKPVAASLGINQGSLSRWLSGKPSLGDEKVKQLFQLIGFDGSKPDSKKVHSWKIKRINFLDLTPALSLYFPKRAKIARAHWVVPGPSIKETFGIGAGMDNLYAITDGHTRAVLRIPRALLLQKENTKDLLDWKVTNQKDSFIQIPEGSESWMQGAPSVAEFDQVWGKEHPEKTIDDLDELCRKKGLSIDEAYAILERTNSKRRKK